MKKISKALISLFLISSIFFPGFVAVTTSSAGLIDPNTYQIGDGDVDQSFVEEYGGKILSYVTIISIIFALISLTYIGLKYITTGSILQKVDYKKDLIPVAIGVFFVSMLTTVLSLIAQFAETI